MGGIGRWRYDPHMTNPGNPDSPSSDPQHGQGSNYGQTPSYGQSSGYGQGSTYGESTAFGQSAPSYGQAATGQSGYSAMSPSYAAGGGAPACPPSNVGWAVASILFFWPLSFVAMTRALEVYPLWAAGRQADAEAASASAKKLGLISLAIVALIIVLYLIFMVVLVGLASTAGSYY